ncbi:MAG: dinitrogenase iron-molybdenum cofactor biosynthesis protein [Syntrophomonadaceae bacterium]|nr:dinitrogenase iron-molybdenum cofactor biosynthesis protein [Syntrophomonadaceae bacterium]
MTKKIAICASSPSPSALVDERFGRCACFVIWDPAIMEYSSLSNMVHDAAHGAGTGAVQSLAKQEVSLVLSQRVGPKAFIALEQAGIKIFSGVAGKTVEDALKSYESGELSELLRPNS